MKSILLAAAAFVAVPAAMPAIAQDTPQTTPPSAQPMPAPADQATPPDSATPADPAATSMPADPAAPATTAPMGQAPMGTPPAPTTAAPTTGDTPPAGGMTDGSGTATPGGIQPSSPPLATPAQPGQPVRTEASASPSQAFPAPAPKDSYPICKKGQYDGCTQASDVRRSAKKSRRR